MVDAPDLNNLCPEQRKSEKTQASEDTKEENSSDVCLLLLDELGLDKKKPRKAFKEKTADESEPFYSRNEG